MDSEILSPETKNEIVTKTHSFIWEIFDTLIKALILILIVLTFGFRMCTVVGSSMQNTLQNGEKLIITSLVKHPQAGDIIVFHETSYLNEPVVKRVIATGNHWVKIDFDNAIVYVSDDEVFDESDIINEEYVYLDIGQYRTTGVQTTFVPEGYLFVMGDNRNNSIDSRSKDIGVIDERTILGKVIFRISPSDKFGIIN
jgi:signal peptidase I